MKKMTFHGVHDIGKTNNINKINNHWNPGLLSGSVLEILQYSTNTAEISSGQIPDIIFSMETGVS